MLSINNYICSTDKNISSINDYIDESYYSRNKGNLGNFFWTDLLLVGSLALSLVAMPFIASYNALKKRVDKTNGKYESFDKDNKYLLTKYPNKAIKQLTIKYLKERNFKQYVDLCKDPDSEFSLFDSAGKRSEDFVKYIKTHKNEIDKDAKVIYFVGLIKDDVIFMGSILSGKKVNNNEDYMPIISIEINEETPNLNRIITELFNHLCTDKTLNIKNGAYIKIENIEDKSFEYTKTIRNKLISNLGFTTIEDDEFGELFFYNQENHKKAIEKLNKKSNKNNNE